MNISLFRTTGLAMLAVIATGLTGCGESHEKVYATDRVEAAAAQAIAAAPAAEPIKFDDEGQPPVGSTIATTATTTTTDAATAEATATDGAKTDTATAASGDTATAAPTDGTATDAATQTASTEATKTN